MKMIRYNGRMLNLREIADIEGIKYNTFMINLRKSGDVHWAVQRGKETKERKTRKAEARPITYPFGFKPVDKIPTNVQMAFWKFMGSCDPGAFNLRAGGFPREYLFDGDLIAYQIMMDKDEATVTARMKSNGNILTKRSVYV